MTLPAAPTKAGYSFLGWFDSTTSGIKLGESSTSYTPTATSSFTIYAQWNIDTYVLTYSAGRNATSPRATDSFQIIDEDLVLPLPVRENFVFEGWFDAASGGNLIGKDGISYRPAASTTIYAQWTQTSLYGVDPSALTLLGQVQANNSFRTSIGAEVDASSISLSIPAGALPAGTTIRAQLVGDFSRAANLITTASNFIFSMVVSWLAPDETVPDTASGKPLSLTITNPAIKAGSSIYSLLGTDVTLLGRATVDGTVTVFLTSDPEIVIVAKVPDSPTSVIATNGENTSSLVTWSAPEINGGSEIISYTVTSSDGQTCITNGELSCRFIGLVNGDSYTFTVFATNAVGSSTISESSTAIIPAVPAPAPAPISGQAPVQQTLVTPLEPIKDSTGSNLSSEVGKSRVVINGANVSSNLEVIDKEIIVVKSGDMTVSLRSLDESRSVKPAKDGAVLEFISREYANIAGDGFMAQSRVKVWLLSTPRLLGEVNVDSQGRFEANLLFSADIPIGEHTIQITGVSRNNSLTAIAVGVIVSERIIQRIDALKIEQIGTTLQISWTGNVKSTRIIITPSRGKTATSVVDENMRSYTFANALPGISYQIRVEPLTEAAEDSFKSGRAVIAPAAPTNLTWEFLGRTSLKISWQGNPGTLHYKVTLINKNKDQEFQITEDSSLFFTVVAGTKYEARLIAVGDGGLETTSLIAKNIVAPRIVDKNKPTQVVTRSVAQYIPLSGNKLPKNLLKSIASLRLGLSKGSAIRCTMFLSDSRFTQGGISLALRRTVNACSVTKKGIKGVESFAAVTKAKTSLQQPKGNLFRIEILRSK